MWNKWNKIFVIVYIFIFLPFAVISLSAEEPLNWQVFNEIQQASRPNNVKFTLEIDHECLTQCQMKWKSEATYCKRASRLHEGWAKDLLCMDEALVEYETCTKKCPIYIKK